MPGSPNIEVSILKVEAGPVPQAWDRLLDDSERAQAERFHFAEDRAAYTASHALLRDRLARAAGCAPSDLEFRRNAYGKPFLAGADHGISFNISHTRGMVAVALGTNPAIGVDVEACGRAISDSDVIASRYFTPREAGVLLHEPSSVDHQTRFMWLWTRKEAVMKAAGMGMSLALSSFSVLEEDLPIRLVGDATGQPLTLSLASTVRGPFVFSAAAGLTPAGLPLFAWHEVAADFADG